MTKSPVKYDTELTIDEGITHLALTVKDINKSAEFYKTFAKLTIVFEHQTGSSHVIWLSDQLHYFALVLIELQNNNDTPLGPFGHIGVACTSKQQVDKLASKAKQQNCLLKVPEESDYPIGYWALLTDPDGNTLELSYCQQIESILRKHQQTINKKNPA